MQKSRRSKGDFRYERVDLARADSSDSEDDLDRVLGPSTAKKKPERKSSKCGCCFAIFGLLLALATLGIVVVYGTVWVPNGIKEQLIKNHLYPFDDVNSTLTQNNQTDETTSTENSTQFSDISTILTTILPENDSKETEKSQENETTSENPDDTKVEESRNANEYLSLNDNFEYPNDVINTATLENEYVRQARNQQSFLDPGNIYPEHDLNTQFEDNYGFDVPNYENDELTSEDLEYIQELIKKHPKNLRREEFLEVEKKSSNEPETIVEEVTKDSIVEEETSKLEEIKETNENQEIPGNLANSKNSESTEMITETSTETILEVIEVKDDFIWPRNLYVSYNFFQQFSNIIFHSFQNEYKDDKVVLAVSVTITICLGLSCFFICLICRRKSRERAKKRHFARLVSDLNATEKFTLVTPSDEEENSD